MVTAAAVAVVGPLLAGLDEARPAVTSGSVATLPPPSPSAPPSAAPPATTAPTARTATAAVKPPAARPRRPAPGTVQYFTMPSGDADGHRREFWVYRPGIPDTADLPVVYFLHGYPGNERAVAESGIAPALERLFASGVAPFVVVAPNGESSPRHDTEWADSADGSVRLEHWIVNFLIPAVEGAHRRDRAHRAIAGFSMGGFGAMNLGLKHPDLFGQIVSMAGYFRVDDPDGMGGDDPQWVAANSPDRRVAAGAASRILLIGAAGESDPLIAGEVQRFRRLAEAAGQHPTVLTAPGPHTFDLVLAQMPTVARFLGAGW